MYLFFLLFFSQIAEEPIKKIEIKIYVDEYKVHEKFLKIALTEKWFDQINPVIKETLSVDSIEWIKSLDKRTDSLKEKMNISFIDRTKEGEKFGFSLNNSLQIYELPNSNLFFAAGNWLELFEYIEEEINWEERHRRWFIIYTIATDRYYAQDYTNQVNFLEKIISERPGWYIGKGYGVFDAEGTYYTSEELGYRSEFALKDVPKEPIKPVNPFKKHFIFND